MQVPLNYCSQFLYCNTFGRIAKQALRIQALALGLLLFVSDTSATHAQQYHSCSVSAPALQFHERSREFGIHIDEIVQEKLSKGQSVVVTDEHLISADEIVYEQSSGVASGRGNAQLLNRDAKIDGDTITFAQHDKTSMVSNPKFVVYQPDEDDPSLRRQQGRGSAEGLALEDRVLKMRSVFYSHCPPDNSDVEIASSTMIIDVDKGQGVARNATITFKQVPIFYSPYLRFPVGSERSSGFLFPTISNSNSSGTGIRIPYYFNLAPNRDATLTTSYFSKRGFHLEGEYRYVGARSDSNILVEWVPRDKKYISREKRYGAEATGKWHDGGNLYANYDISWVSDGSFLEDYSGQFSKQSADYLQQNLKLSYANNNFVASVGVNKYLVTHTVPEDVDIQPHNRVPWASLNFRLPVGERSEIKSVWKWDRFRHADKDDGKRLYIDSSFVHRFSSRHTQLDLRVGGELLRYKIARTGDNAIEPKKPKAQTGYATIDARMFFDRFATDGSGRRWTLVPRLKIVATEDVDQSHLPNFDTTLAEINNYEKLFRDSAYIGGDRLRDTDQLSYGLALHFYDPTRPSQVASAGIGRIVYPNRKFAQWPDSTEPKINNSDIFFGANFADDSTQASYSALLHNDTHKIRKSQASLSHQFNENLEFTTVGRHTRARTSLWANALTISLNDSSSMQIRHVQSYDPDRLETASVALDYNTCCASLRAALSREVLPNGSYDKSFHIFINLFPSF